MTCERFIGRSETCECGEVTLPPFDPAAALDAVVAELAGPAFIDKRRQRELAALLTRARVEMEDDAR